ncbi:MAG: diguanylate cyclase [Candidatus Limnocylindria bacterium]
MSHHHGFVLSAIVAEPRGRTPLRPAADPASGASGRDSLTGAGNRLALDEAITRLLDQGDRLRPLPFALILLDIDHFKAYNDQHGHLAGDAALGRLGPILRQAIRGTDLAFRYGGEEFLLLLPDIDLPGAIAVAERVRRARAQLGIRGARPAPFHGVGWRRPLRPRRWPGSGATPATRRRRALPGEACRPRSDRRRRALGRHAAPRDCPGLRQREIARGGRMSP